MAQRIGQNKVLGLAIGERSIVVAEAARVGETPRVTLAATFHYPLEVTLDNPAAVGEALGAFLKDKGFTARQAVFGVPARWVLSKAKEVPPADPAVIADALRLQVEGEFTQELRELSFDYAGEVSAEEPKQVLLVALQGKHLEQIKAIAEAARLQLSAITPVGCVLGAATASLAGKPRQAMVVSVGPGGVELAALDGPGTPRVLRHLGASASSPAMLAGEFRRATFAGGMLPIANGAGHGAVNGGVNGNGNGNGRGGPTLVIWDASALSDASRRALADAAGARIEQGDLQSLGVPEGLSGGAADVAGAAALAIAALSDEPLPADFLHSKLAEPKRFAIPPRTMMLIGGGVVLLAVIIFVIASLWSLNGQVDAYQAEIESRKKEITANKDFIKKVRFAEGWHTRDPKFLLAMRDLISRLPDNNQRDGLLYVTELSVDEPAAPGGGLGSRVPVGEMLISLKGRSPSYNRYNQFIRSLAGGPFKIQTPSFQKVGNTDQVEFRVQLFYTPGGMKQASADAPPPSIELIDTTPTEPQPGTQPATQPGTTQPTTGPATTSPAMPQSQPAGVAAPPTTTQSTPATQTSQPPRQ